MSEVEIEEEEEKPKLTTHEKRKLKDTEFLSKAAEYHKKYFADNLDRMRRYNRNYQRQYRLRLKLRKEFGNE